MESTALLAAGAIVGTIGTIRLIYYIFYIIANWKIFSKAGEPGWKSIIPLYNTYTLYKLVWKPEMAIVFIVLDLVSAFCLNSAGISILMLLIGIVTTIAYLVVDFKSKNYLSKAFGHGTGFAWGLFILQPIFSMILGFGSSEYQGNQS